MGIVRSVNALIPVEYGQFWVIAGSGDDSGDFTATEEFVEVGGSGLLCMSAAGYHTASLTLEAWDTAPDADDEDWEVVQSVELTRGRGRFYAYPLSGGPLACELDFDLAEGARLTARVACSGRSDVFAWVAADNVEDPPDGTERWRVQFSPVQVLIT